MAVEISNGGELQNMWPTVRAAHLGFQTRPSRRASSQERAGRCRIGVLSALCEAMSAGINFDMMTNALGMRDMA